MYILGRSPLLAYCALAVALGLVLGGCLGRQVPAVGAWTASSSAWLQVQEDGFYNYDFNSQTLSYTNHDWPVTMIFWNNADINRVKTRTYGSGYPGSSQYFYMNDGGGGVWDEDGGIKDVGCPTFGQFSRHLRLYAPPGADRAYNIQYGFYVLGTTHKDYQECTLGAGGSQFGWSEESEGYWAGQANSSAVNHNCCLYHNYEAPRWEGNHYWDNNGYATSVYVP